MGSDASAPAASIIEKSKLGMKETSSKLSAEKVKSSKFGSIKLNPSPGASASASASNIDK